MTDVVQFWQICLYDATKTHAEIISNAGITFSGYEKTGRAGRAELPFQVIFSHTQSQPAWPGGVQIIKMVTVMRLITLIVFTTTQHRHNTGDINQQLHCLPGTSGVGRVAYLLHTIIIHISF